MNNTTRWRVAVVLVLVPASVWAVWLRPNPLTSAEPPVRQKWEYCQLIWNRNLSVEGESVRLRRGAEEVQATSMKDLGEKLKLTTNQEFSGLTVLNALGDQGWELVAESARTHEQRDVRYLSISWTFKRPK